MSDHIRNISGEKFKLEKKNKEYEKELKEIKELKDYEKEFKCVDSLSKSSHLFSQNAT